MRVYGLWYGGSGYGLPEREDLEQFESIGHARTALERRCYVGGHIQQDVTYADGRTTSVFFPAVDASSTEIHLFLTEPDDDLYPDRVIKFGPRGGVHIVNVG